MICANCGGEIHVNESCSRCGISYDEMIHAINHDEMVALLEKIEKKISNRENIDVEESLLACDLLNAHFLMPVEIRGDTLGIGSAEGVDGKNYILIFTDMEEYNKMKFDLNPRTNPFNEYLMLLGTQFEGFIINYANQGCQLTRAFLEKYFEGDIGV